MEWLLRLESAPDDKALRAEFDVWLARDEAHRRAFHVMGHTWERLGGLPHDKSPAPSTPPQPLRHGRRAATLAAAALAACMALFLLSSVHLRLLADHVTGVAELRDVTLADSSVVQLDAGSAIAVKYGADRREVTLLKGQAFFRVATERTRPFVVGAGEVKVTVTGTAFSVQASDESVAVAVESGAVNVSIDDGRLATALSPGQRLRVDRQTHQMVRGEIELVDVASWRNHRLVVHDALLGDVVEALGRRHDGMIVLRDEALRRRLVTGVFDLRRPVEALNAVVESQNAKLTSIAPWLLVISPR